MKPWLLRIALGAVFLASLAATIRFGTGSSPLSPGPEPSPTPLRVADVTGRELAPARNALRSIGLWPVIVVTGDEAGHLWSVVLDQDPPPGTPARRGDRVTFYVPSLERPPVNLPEATAGDCPVTEARHSPQFRTALGDGPVVLGSRRDDGLVRLTNGEGEGLHRISMLWGLKEVYEGPILIRGDRIDGRGDLRFRQDPEPVAEGVAVQGSYNEIRFPPGALTQDTPRHAVVTFAGGPGCYAFQIDGEDVRQTIVVRAID